MRDPERINRIVAKLVKAWKLSPDQRLAQLVSNAVAYATNHDVTDIFHVEDDITEIGLDKMIEELKHPKPVPPAAAEIAEFIDSLKLDPSTK